MADVYALDLDEEFLSHLSDPESVALIWAEGVRPELLEDDFVRSVFTWQFRHLREHGKPATASVLAEEFDVDFEEPLTAVGDLVDRLRERFMRNNSRSYMERIVTAYKEDPSQTAEALIRTGRELQALVGKKGEQYGTGDYLRVMQEYDKAVLRGPGPSFGFDQVDKHFHGMTGVTVGMAPPKTYKSWIYGGNTVVKNIECGRCTVLYSLELPAKDTDMRIRCLAAGVPYWRYLRGSLSNADRELLRETSDLLDSLGMYRVIKPPPGHRTFEEMIERAGDMGADAVVVDQLQYVETQSGLPLGGCKPQEFWQPLNAARDMSDDMPLMIVHQFNRSVMNADKMPEMQQAKGAAAIEEVATLALGLWANKDMRRSNLVELGTLASRHYTYQSWEIQVELSHGCDFQLLGVVNHDDDDD